MLKVQRKGVDRVVTSGGCDESSVGTGCFVLASDVHRRAVKATVVASFRLHRRALGVSLSAPSEHLTMAVRRR